MDMISVHKNIVHPWMCDSMGHLTTRFYVALFDDASYHLLFSAFGYAPNVAGFEHRGWADVRHVIEYKAELRVGALIEVHAAILQLGGKSLKTLYEMKDASSGQSAATLEATTVYFDLNERKAISLTDSMRVRAQGLMSG